jgi:hypothetical protein
MSASINDPGTGLLGLKGRRFASDADSMADARTRRSGHGRRWHLPLARRRSHRAPQPTALFDVPKTAIPDGWFLYCDVDLDSETAPLVLAGVRGVFVVEAHRTSGTVVPSRSGLTVAGTQRPDIVETAQRRAMMLGDTISAPTSGLIVFEAHRVQAGWAGGVPVVALQDLRSFLVNQSTRRSPWDEFKRVRSALTARAA